MLRLFLIFIFALALNDSYADIYKYTDSNGVVTYTNLKPDNNQKSELVIKGSVNSPPDTTSSSPQTKTQPKKQTPANFPKVDTATQSQRDQKRKEILLNELNQEQQALENAKLIYNEEQNKPEVYRGANGKTYRNVAKYDEKLRVIEAEIEAHERNIDLLNRELGQ